MLINTLPAYFVSAYVSACSLALPYFSTPVNDKVKYVERIAFQYEPKC